MSELPNVVVVTARCSRGVGEFGIRMEEFGRRNWVGTWAFKLNASAAGREGYNATRLEGKFAFGETYPGCTYCSAGSAYQCSCNKLSCWTGETNDVSCPWCGASATISGSISSLDAGGDA